jgi:sortase A
MVDVSPVLPRTAPFTGGTNTRLQCLQWAFLVIGVAALAWCSWVTIEARLFQARHRATLERAALSAQRADGRGSPTVSTGVASGVVGELVIPRLKLSAVVVEGDDEETLKVAVGHLPDTPLPWQPGNSAFAGHRDTFFRVLKSVRIGDEMRVATLHGELRYRVERTRVVEPDDLSVLEPSAKRRLTLITCFPFSYVGSAPRRFVVHAEQIDPPSA